MKTKAFRLSILFSLTFLTFLIAAAPCWAKAPGYLFVMAYSFSEKKVYFSPVFEQKVRDISYSDEEYVTEVELIQKIESQFQEFLSSVRSFNPSKYTFSVKGAYKSKGIADKIFKQERGRYLKKGYTASSQDRFVFDD